MSKYFDLSLENAKEHSQKVFGPKGNAALAQKIKKEDPAQYASLRRDAVKQRLLEPTRKEQAAVLKQQWKELEHPKLTSIQVEAIDMFPKATFKAVTAEEAQRMKKEDPATYKLFRIAGATHGFLSQDILQQLPADSGDDGTLYEIPAAFRERLNLEPSLRLTRAGLERAGKAYADSFVKEAQEAENAGGAQ